MPLTLAQLEAIRMAAYADDIAIDVERMIHWTEAAATTFFESGGTVAPEEAAWGDGAWLTCACGKVPYTVSADSQIRMLLLRL